MTSRSSTTPATPVSNPASAQGVELLPCPFCGGSNLTARTDDIDGWIAHIECRDCDDMIGPMSEFKYTDDKPSAIADASRVWNRRASDTAPSRDAAVPASGGVEAGRHRVADAINRARYWSPEPGLPERGVDEEDPRTQEYAFRLADAAIASLSPAPTSGSEAGGEAVAWIDASSLPLKEDTRDTSHAALVYASEDAGFGRKRIPLAILMDRERLRQKIASEPDMHDDTVDILTNGLEDIILTASSNEADRLSRCLETARATLGFAVSARKRAHAKPASSEAEAIAFITKLVHMQSGQGWTRAIVRDAAANFLKSRGIAITGHADTTPEIAALAKPASGGVREAAIRGIIIDAMAGVGIRPGINSKEQAAEWAAAKIAALSAPASSSPAEAEAKEGQADG